VKIDFMQELKDFAGEPLQLQKDGPNLTLKEAITISIRSALQEDAHAPLADKIALDRIGELVYQDGGEIDTGQATIIKERIAKVFTAPAVSGAVKRAIEG
jgi:hypothetical protein